MASLQMHVVAAVVRLTRKRKMSTPERALARMKLPKASSQPPAELLTRHELTCELINGFECWTVKPKAGASRGALYVHGGSFIAEISDVHWSLVSDIVDAGVQVAVPMYGLAPKFTYRDAYPLLREAYARLIAEVEPASVAITGDSSGAGLALGFVQDLAAADQQLPSQLVLLSPWVDLMLTDNDIERVAERDPWLTPAGLREAGKAWADGDDPELPELSPINGELNGLPPTDIYIGTRDIFLPSVRRLAELAASTNWQLRVTECPGAIHVYPLFPVPEGKAARARIIETIAGR